MSTQSQEFHRSQEPTQTETVLLEPGLPTVIDSRNPLDEGLDHTVVAQINAGNSEFMLLDLGSSKAGDVYKPFGGKATFTKRFLLVDKSFDPFDKLFKTGFKGIDEHETVIGRSFHTSRFHYKNDEQLSRRHFTLREQDGNIIITDQEARNRTYLTTHKQSPAEAVPADPQERVRQFQEKLRAKQEADLRARQAAQARHNETQRAARQNGEQAIRPRIQDAAERQEQLDGLVWEVRDVVEEFEKDYPDIELRTMASFVSRILNDRYTGASDKDTFKKFAAEFHPDKTHDLPADKKLQAETMFKLINDMYDSKEKSFKF